MEAFKITKKQITWIRRSMSKQVEQMFYANFKFYSLSDFITVTVPSIEIYYIYRLKLYAFLLPFLNFWCSDQYFSTTEKPCKRILNWLVSRERGINEKRNVRKAIDWNLEVLYNTKVSNSLKHTAILWNLRLLAN